MKTNNNDNNILKRLLTPKDLHLMEEAYGYMNGMPEGKYRDFLLRRIDDVISMARYIDLMAPYSLHEDYDALYGRLTYLELALRHFRNKSNEDPRYSYSEISSNTPRILTSISTLDYERYHEVDNLVFSAFHDPSQEMPLYHELKKVRGNAFQVIYAHKGDSVMIYDICSVVKKREELNLDEIRKRCLAELEENSDPTIQAIYDDIVYSALHFDTKEQNGGYRLVKERGITHKW